MITFLAEGWDSYAADPALRDLWTEHYNEFSPVHLGKLPMGPDEQSYKAMSDAGMLEVVVARKEGKMIGYCLILIKRHLHYDALTAFEDSYFITKSERRGGTGTALIQKAREVARARGCRLGYWMTKEFNSVALLFERLGMERVDSVFIDWLEV